MASTITADNGVVSGSAGIKSSADSSGVLALATGTGTTAVTIDASQNVGIGTSSVPSDAKVAISGTGLVLQDASGAIQRFNKTLGTDTAWVSNRSYGWHDGNGLAISTQTADALKFGTNSAERMRIDTSGNLLVGTTSGGERLVVAAAQDCASFKNTGGTGKIYFLNSASSTIGSITWTGSTTTYATSSDYRLKNTVEPMIGALARIAALKPVTYKWNVDGSGSEGFIAHELAEVCPQAVVGEKDAVDADGNPVYQGIDTSFLVATLTAAIQELKAINDTQAQAITSLTERVTALEAK